MSDQELEDQLREAGTKLVKPPASVDELLNLLDEIDNCLSKVEQSPPKSMQDALSASMNALVASELLKHPDTDVKVFVASCVSEITRITAPDAPYNDDQMKEIFQLIVAAFEDLGNTSSRSYLKRVSILETVAKVRSCVVMLDLECDGLILEMFQHFLKAIRDNNGENVFSSMETIMSLVLEESEEISTELLSPLLTSVKRDNRDVLPIARKLAEKVLENCTTKLKPYLMQALRSMDTSPNDYSKIVASICEVSSDVVEHNDDTASAEHLADESKSDEKISSDKPLQVAEETEPAASCPGEVDAAVDQSSKNVMSNGDALMENIGSLEGIEQELSRASVQPADAEPDSLDSNIVQSETKPDQATKKRGRKSNSLVHTAEASGHTQIDSDKETSDPQDQTKGHGKEAESSPSDHETLPQVHSPSASRDEPVKVASPAPSQSLPDGVRSKRGRSARAKKGNINDDTDHDLPAAPNEPEIPSSRDVISKKEPLGSSEMESKPQKHSGKKTPLVKGSEDDVALTKDVGITSDSETKPLKRSGKKVNVKNGNEDDVVPPKDAAVPTSDSETKPLKRSGKKVIVKDTSEDDVAPTKDAGVTSDSETKPVKRSAKKVNAKDGNEEESLEKKQGGKGKKGKGTPISKGDIHGQSSNKKTVSTSKSNAKAPPKNQKHQEETPKTTSKRKRASGKDEPSETSTVKEYGEDLVGAHIKVLWPDDDMFYEGVVESFDPIEKKHKVSYVDGDEEILLLKDERWEFVDTMQDEENADLPSPNVSESQRKKKAKTNPDSSSKQTKADASSKRGKGASTSKSKDEGTKSGAKSKEEDKVDSRTSKAASKSKNDKGDTPKTSGKAKVETPKTAGKSKDDTPKTGTKSKDDTPKTGTKSKEDTRKAATKSKDDTPKTAVKSKDSTSKTSAKSKSDTPKTGTKSKDETPKTGTKDDTPKTSAKSKATTSKAGNKSKANGSSAKAKSSASKVEESEEESPKGKSSGSTAKAQGSGAKSGSKRKRKS